MSDTLTALYALICQRKTNPEPDSYTCYLFEKGLDKILKKVGEECSETIIAAKNGDNTETANEICDLLYHLMVLMAEQNIDIVEIQEQMEQRRQKIGNLKTFHQTNKDS